MDKLTPFERALLAQFETLVSASETSLKASEATSQQLQTLSETVRKRLDSIERKQREIERFQTQLLHSLSSHRANQELGAAGERVSGRVAEMTRERELVEQRGKGQGAKALEQRERVREKRQGPRLRLRAITRPRRPTARSDPSGRRGLTCN